MKYLLIITAAGLGLAFWQLSKPATTEQAQAASGAEAQTEYSQKHETIYFDPQSKTWNDASGPCYTCTSENGFSLEGQIDGAPAVTWQEMFLTLKNDLGENPPLKEVEKLFTTHYSADPSWFGTYVEVRDGVFRIVLATDHEETDFLDERGVLKAWYEAENAR